MRQIEVKKTKQTLVYQCLSSPLLKWPLTALTGGESPIFRRIHI
jgi:hypothetical protein